MSNFIKKTSLFFVLFGALTFGLKAPSSVSDQEQLHEAVAKKAPSKIARFFAKQHRKEAARSVATSLAELIGKFGGVALQNLTNHGKDASKELGFAVFFTGSIPDIAKALTRFGFDCADERFLQGIEVKVSESGDKIEKIICYLIIDGVETAVDFTELKHDKKWNKGFFKEFGTQGHGFTKNPYGDFVLSMALRAIKEEQIKSFVSTDGVVADFVLPASTEAAKVVKFLDLEKMDFMDFFKNENNTGKVNQNKLMSKGLCKAVNEIASRILAKSKMFKKSGKTEKYNRLAASLIAALFSPLSAKGIEYAHPVS